MPIELVTGLPGHGKTLLTIARYRELVAKNGRQVFQHGIKELKLPWPEWTPERWQELEPGSIFIIDECQTCFPVRGRDRPPPWIEELAKHRHKGIDFVLITQNPMLMDSFVRRLVDRHFHIVRKFGTHFATVHEFANGVKENVATSRDGSITHEQRYPKDVFELYKSAELHTVKARIPMRVWILISVPIILAVLGWIIYQRLKPENVAARMNGGVPVEKRDTFASASGGPGNQASPNRPLTPEEYAAQYKPRIAQLPHTAPVYDKITDPMEAPYPAACLATASRCKCYTQQGTQMHMDDDVCRQIAAGGFFLAWKTPAPTTAAKAPEPPRADVVPAISLGGSRPPTPAQSPHPAAPAPAQPRQ